MSNSNTFYIKKAAEPFDAIVVGSGISGGWAAKELCEKGLKTLMVERGRNVEHRKDYIGEGVPPWKMPFRGQVEKELADNEYFVQQRCYAFNDATKHFFMNDKDYPYQTPKGRPWSWIRGNQLGGKSLLWHRQSYRMSELDFNANAIDGHGVDWPIRYADLAPWYDHVEVHAGISGSRENLAILPDSKFLPPFELNAVEKAMKVRIEKQWKDRKLIIGRCAHLSVPAPHHLAQGRIQCQARNECQKGCSFGAYFSTQSSTLPAAVKTGNLTVATDSIVHSVIYDPNTNRATGVRVIDAETLEVREYFAKVVFLCASTLGTTQIMLNSVSEQFPTGIANSSGALGHYLMDHLYGAGASGRVEGFGEEYYSGRRPTGIVIPRFRNLNPQKPDADFLRGYFLMGGAHRENWNAIGNQEGFGAELKQKIRTGGDWIFSLSGSGEMLPRYENQVSLHPTLKDKWGMPQLLIDCALTENDWNMFNDIADTCANILETIGVKNVSKHISAPDNWEPGLAIHEMGTARMGKDPKSSVLNGWNQAHDVPNLFVTDGACMSSCAWQNPSLTYMAISARAADYAAQQLKQGKL
ncbi:GMC oxidoreductase [Cellvibrio japonicus]|uniref:Oxidoreductase, GMC family n=1 Tax=Cellvibrio japonicus (strain Ueda107) TaxID=498211 RepID=B3PDE3_CELJU|nr:GMC family oxidoreductase [Cellvibrio japonicus]ACE82844.1 oxidoreductase, GMC family [Cellvibrio japonicus Ueda107]QEI13393.1 GMC family oxidoreductase [Cellvibrio japonicus]QEI16967.1 GMC family oxidoreductase [Cellvibrio japonicus]QEI20545.1 GMC family oxidoreductase [Cellvibrio japonicus]